MCNVVSWIEKDGKLYWAHDDEVEAKYGVVTNNHCGHKTVRDIYKLEGGTEYESALKVPPEIAASVNRGEMKKLAKVGGWNGLHFSKGGINNTSYWVKFENEFRKYKNKTYHLDNHGPVDPSWIVFETIDQGRDQGRDQVRDQGRDQGREQAYEQALGQAHEQALEQAWDQVWIQARKQARDQSLERALEQALSQSHDLSNLISSAIIEGYESTEWHDYFKRRFSIWEAGYGCICDINGVFYVYKKI